MPGQYVAPKVMNSNLGASARSSRDLASSSGSNAVSVCFGFWPEPTGHAGKIDFCGHVQRHPCGTNVGFEYQGCRRRHDTESPAIYKSAQTGPTLFLTFPLWARGYRVSGKVNFFLQMQTFEEGLAPRVWTGGPRLGRGGGGPQWETPIEASPHSSCVWNSLDVLYTLSLSLSLSPTSLLPWIACLLLNILLLFLRGL